MINSACYIGPVMVAYVYENKLMFANNMLPF